MHSIWLTVGLVLIGPLAVCVGAARRRQMRALRALAVERRLGFEPEDLIDVQDRYQNLDLIRQGYSRHACNVLYGPSDVGMVTAFMYHYEEGFGGQRAGRNAWFAVIETPHVYGHWRAWPAETDATAPAARIGRFHVQADQAETLAELRRAGIETFLETAPARTRYEVRGPLVAAVAPFESDVAAVRCLLDTAGKLARRLGQHRPKTP